MPKSKQNQPALLGPKLSAKQFLARHWQKKPLLVRGAMPGLEHFIDRDTLVSLALREDVESRLIVRRGNAWSVHHGPLDPGDFSGLPKKKNWTLLVQDVQHHIDPAWEILAQFNFIPYARLDDLMVSYAADGGGVGPHYDSYDVFLIQAAGKRRWRVAKKFDASPRTGVPLKMIEAFEAEQEWLLESGDMLYLPPNYAHEGVAEGECITLSVGFRAPRAYELALAYLQELAAAHDYGPLLRDIDLIDTQTPARLDRALIHRYRQMIEQLDWHYGGFADFLGVFLSEPKSHTEFDIRTRGHSADGFARRMQAAGVRLNGKTRMLYYGREFFINGEQFSVAPDDSKPLSKLADTRRLAGQSVSEELMTLLYSWYRDGFLELEDSS